MKKNGIIIILLLLQTICYGSEIELSPKAQIAKDLVYEAIDYYQEVGFDAAMQEFSNKEGKFVKGEFYIFVIRLTGETVGHGGNVGLVGKNLIELKDPDGKLFMKEFISVAENEGQGWVEYRWSNPSNNKIQEKIAFVKLADSSDLVFGCGYYK